MKNDYLDVANAVGMPETTDSTVAMDLLLDAKNGVKTCAIALTEATSPQVRATLLGQLRAALSLYNDATEMMLTKGWLHPDDLSHQAHVDRQTAEMAQMIAGLELFPGSTNRLGLFPTDLNSGRKGLS